MTRTCFEERVLAAGSAPLSARGIDLLQANLGYRCNMTCRHCHIGAGPGRSEMMGRPVIDSLLAVIGASGIRTLDITGGAPELNPHFACLVEGALTAGCHVIVRTNLTVFFEKGMEGLFDFYRDKPVEIIASLPYYSEHEADRVRGAGAFNKSIAALRRLNGLGFGAASSRRKISLVYNPPGAFLPASQEVLEGEYRAALARNFGVSFTDLFTFSNMPLGRFREFLERSGNLGKYLDRLKAAFNPATLEGLMCRRLVSVGWDGMLYDCDFNQVAGLGIEAGGPQHISDFDFERLSCRKISVGEHCFGCTAGQGST